MQRILTIAAGIVLALLGLSISLAVFAVLAVFGSVAFAYYWWKTRELRRQLHEHLKTRSESASATTENQQSGVVIDGEWSSDSNTSNRLP